MNRRGFVFLDLDNTILDFDRAETEAVAQVLGRLGHPEMAEQAAMLYPPINLRWWKRLEQGKADRPTLKKCRYAELFAALGIEADPNLANEYYQQELARRGYLLPGADKLLEVLAGRHHLFAASNGSADVQKGRIEMAGIGPYFERVFISEELGADKPDPGYFERCFAQIPGFDLSRSVMVGDSLTSDMAGGIRAGMHTLWYDPACQADPGEVLPEWRVHSLDAIPDLIGRIIDTI